MNKARKLLEQVTDILESNYEDKDTSVVFHKQMKNMPKSLNGKEFKSYEAPKKDEDWAKVDGQKHDLKEPPISNKNGKKISSGLIMHEPDGRVWMTKPSNEFGGYKHTFPKGRAEPGLSLQANAIKEAYEETGLKGKITGHAGDAEGDTTVTRYYHATRDGGHPLEHGWESEAVVLAPKHKLHDFLNRDRDRIFAHKNLGSPKPKLNGY